MVGSDEEIILFYTDGELIDYTRLSVYGTIVDINEVNGLGSLVESFWWCKLLQAWGFIY